MGPYYQALMRDDSSICDDAATRQQTMYGVAGVVLANFVYQLLRTTRTPYQFHRINPGGRKNGKRSTILQEYAAVEIPPPREFGATV